MSSDYQRLNVNETQLSDVSAVGHNENSEKGEETPLASLIKMQEATINKENGISDIVIDAWNQGEQIAKDALEFNKIAEK